MRFRVQVIRQKPALININWVRKLKITEIDNVKCGRREITVRICAPSAPDELQAFNDRLVAAFTAMAASIIRRCGGVI